MPMVDLTEQEWGALMALISEAPWRQANPLLMKIGEQLRAKALHDANKVNPVQVNPGNGQEARRE